MAAAVNRLANHDATKQQLETYQKQMELMKLDGEVATAKRNLKQVQVTNASELAQVEAQLFESKENVQRQQARISQLQRQLENCTIRAPHDGMVVYAQDEQGNIAVAVGQAIRSRQELLTLPDLTRMRVRTQIHEAVLDQVRPGQPVTLKVDAFPNEPYQGVVDRVAVVPSSNSNNVKTYECVINIPGQVDKLKPGMTAVSEIHVDRLKNVVSLPVQAVVQMDGETWCYVDNDNGIERREVELGRNNDKFVQIVKGIADGDRAVLNPMAIASLENREKKTISPESGSDIIQPAIAVIPDTESAQNPSRDRGQAQQGREGQSRNADSRGERGQRQNRQAQGRTRSDSNVQNESGRGEDGQRQGRSTRGGQRSSNASASDTDS